MPEIASSTKSRSSGRRGAIIALVILALLAAALGIGTYLLVRFTGGPDEPVGTEGYRTAWESAMRKAGVEATLPPEPTPLTSYRASGSHPFESTFTAEEATALLNVYTFAYESGGQTADLKQPRITFVDEGVIRIESGIESSGQSGDIAIEGPVTYAEDAGVRAGNPTEVSFEGIPLGGAQASHAVGIAIAYGNAYLRAAPGLTAERAVVVRDGVRVTGQAPDRLELSGP